LTRPREEVIKEIKLLEEEREQLLRESFDDERDKKSKASFGGLVKQLTLGAVNSALFDFPKFFLDKDGNELFERSASRSERIARGVGTTAGFLFGGPGKLLAKGTQLGGKLGTKIATKGLVKSGAKLATKKAAKKIALGKSVTAGAVAFGALEAVSAPEEAFSEKAFTVPISTTIGGMFGLAEPFVAKAIRKSAVNLNRNILYRKSRMGARKNIQEMSKNIHNLSVKTDKQFHSLLKTKSMRKAYDFGTAAYAGKKKWMAQQRVKLANMERVSKSPKLKAMLLSNDATKIAEASTKGMVKNMPNNASEALKALGTRLRYNNMITSAGVMLNKSGSVSAQEIGKRGFLIRDIGERSAGNAITDFRLSIDRLSPKQLLHFREVLEENVAMGKDKAVKEAVLTATKLFNDVAKISGQHLKDFIPKKGLYFPHLQIDVNSSKKVVDETLKASVRRGEFGGGKNALPRARKAWEEYSNLIKKKQGNTKELLDYIEAKHHIPREKARKMLFATDSEGRTFFDNFKQYGFGNLERARGSQISFPFYDVNPQRAIERYLYGAHTRLAEVKLFGRNFELYDGLMERALAEGADRTLLEQVKNRFMGATLSQKAFDVIKPETSATIRSVQTITKLGLAMIPNATQSINTAMVTNIGATADAIKKSLSKKTKQEATRFALRSGSTLEASIQEYIKNLGLDGSFTILGQRVSATKFLEKTGFVWMERMNRIISANAGKNYSIDIGKRLLNNPKDKLAIRAFKRMKIDPKEVLKKGIVTDEMQQTAAQQVTNITQFRAGPLDLPLFFTSPEGKLLAQFKTFSFNQAKMVKNLLKEEVAKGNLRPLITAVALMPILGEGVKDLRGLLSGQVRDSKGMERILDNISAVGAAGMLNDLWASASYNNIEGAMLGPTGSDISKILEGSQRALKGKPESLTRFGLRNIPIVGPRIANTVVPSRRLKRMREKRKRERAKARGK